MKSWIFPGLFFLSFVFGQFGRVQIAPGVALSFLDITVFLFVIMSFVRPERKVLLWQVVGGKLFAPTVSFLAVCLFSLLFSMQTLSGSELVISSLYLLRLVFYIGFLFVIPSLPAEAQKRLLQAAILGVFSAVCIGYIQLIYYPNLGNLFYLGWDDHLYRLFSVFLDPNFAGVLFSLLFIYLLSTFVSTNGNKRIHIGIAAFITLISIFLTYSRTGMLALLVGSVTLLWCKGYKKFIAALGLLFVMLLIITSDVKVEGLNPFRTASTSARVESMRIAVAIFQKSPIIGVGFNSYRYAQHRFGFRPDGAWESSHADSGTDNSFLFVLATTGIIGFISYIFVWVQILRLLLLDVRKKKSGAILVFSMVCALSVSSLFLNTLFYPFILVWFFLFLGSALSKESRLL